MFRAERVHVRLGKQFISVILQNKEGNAISVQDSR